MWKAPETFKTKTKFKKHMKISSTLELFVEKMLKLAIGSDILEQIEYQPPRLISLNWTHKIALKLKKCEYF